MDVRIVNIEPVSDTEWDSVWRVCDYATYFHSRHWAELWERYHGGRVRRTGRLLQFSDGATAVVPLVERKRARGLVRAFESAPAGTFGGWISSATLTTNHARRMVDYLLGLGTLSWRINPYDPLAASLGLRDVVPDETHVVELERPFQEIFRTWSKGHRAAVRQAEREGIAVRCADSSEDWNAYYRVYRDSVERWGEKATVVYERTLFDELSKDTTGDVRLWVALHEDEIVAGALCLYAHSHVVYWHGAASADHFPKRPVNLLVYHALKHACESGRRWFDFNPSGGQEGVRRFKKSFGAEARPCPILKVESKMLGWARRILGKVV